MATGKGLSETRPNGTTRSSEASTVKPRPRIVPLAERLRNLRVAAGLTQSDLAGGRFSKEYLSQIERGKTRPTAETLEWLAARLGVDASYLESGVSADERGLVEAALARAEALSESHRYEEALQAFARGRVAVAGTGSPELELRALLG